MVFSFLRLKQQKFSGCFYKDVVRKNGEKNMLKDKDILLLFEPHIRFVLIGVFLDFYSDYIFFFFFFFWLFRTTPATYGGSEARGQIGAEHWPMSQP